jgi:hypothetical protein
VASPEEAVAAGPRRASAAGDARPTSPAAGAGAWQDEADDGWDLSDNSLLGSDEEEGRAVAAAPAVQLQAPPALSPAVAAAPLGGQQLVQASPFSRRLSGAELNRKPPPLSSSNTSSAPSTPSTSSDDDDDEDDGDDGYDASVRVQAPTAALPQPPLELFAPGVLAKGTHSCRNAGGVRFLIPYACGPRRFRRRACGCRIPTARCVVHLGWWCFTNSYRVRARAAGRGAPILGSHSKRFAKVACRRQR